MAKGVVFFTGFPGFIGRRLVAKLLDQRDERIVALVEPRFAEQARAVAAELDGDRIEILPGDIGDRRLGVDDETYERLTKQVTSAHHLAAIYDLAVP
jgi:thioester reductase-like protein